MKKTSFLKIMRGLSNGVKDFEQYTIANVGWSNKPWKLVKKDEEFENVKKDNYKPIAEFFTREDLWQFIKNN